MKLIGQQTFPNTDQGYYDAEKFATQWAGDNSGYAVVVEDYENDKLHVMDESEAEGFLAESLVDAGRTKVGGMPQVIFHADYRAWCHTCEIKITGQVITSHDFTYCSFACLSKRGRK